MRYSLAESLPGIAPINQFEADLYTFKSVPIGSGNYSVVEANKNATRVTLKRVRNLNPGLVGNVIFLNTSGRVLDHNLDIAMNAGIDDELKFHGFRELSLSSITDASFQKWVIRVH